MGDSHTVQIAKEIDRLSRCMQKLMVTGRVICNEYTEVSTTEGEAILTELEFEGESIVLTYLAPKDGENPQIVLYSKKFNDLEVSAPGLDIFQIRTAPIVRKDLS